MIYDESYSTGFMALYSIMAKILTVLVVYQDLRCLAARLFPQVLSSFIDLILPGRHDPSDNSLPMTTKTAATETR